MVAGFQHLLGLTMALALYATLTRRHAARWAAALATAPLPLDAYQPQMEQTIMPDVTFEARITARLTTRCARHRSGRGRPGIPGPGRGRRQGRSTRIDGAFRDDSAHAGREELRVPGAGVAAVGLAELGKLPASGASGRRNRARSPAPRRPWPPPAG